MLVKPEKCLSNQFTRTFVINSAKPFIIEMTRTLSPTMLSEPGFHEQIPMLNSGRSPGGIIKHCTKSISAFAAGLRE